MPKCWSHLWGEDVRILLRPDKCMSHLRGEDGEGTCYDHVTDKCVRPTCGGEDGGVMFTLPYVLVPPVG